MLSKRFLRHAYCLGRAYKYTFSQGHGVTRGEIFTMEKERKGLAGRLRDTVTGQGFVPAHIQFGEAFCYETELYAFLNRIGASQSYVFESTRQGDKESLLSLALIVVLSHESSCENDKIKNLRQHICELGKAELSSYLTNYFENLFPKISSDMLFKLSSPNTCLTTKACTSLYKHLCLHDLIQNMSNEPCSDEEYLDAAAGIFVSLAILDTPNGALSSTKFIQNFILNYYSSLDYRDLVNYDSMEKAEAKLNDYLSANNMGIADVRLISTDGEKSHLPLYTVGMFSREDCLSMAADHNVEDATLQACNAALCQMMFSERNQMFGDELFFYKPSDDVISSSDYIKQSLAENADFTIPDMLVHTNVLKAVGDEVIKINI